jgi:hypothetical protein
MHIFLAEHFTLLLKNYFRLSRRRLDVRNFSKEIRHMHAHWLPYLPTGQNVPKNSNLTDACTHNVLLLHIGQHTTSTMDYNLQTQQDNADHEISVSSREITSNTTEATLHVSLQICPLFSWGTTLAKNLFLSSLPPLINGRVGEKRAMSAWDGGERGENIHYVTTLHVIEKLYTWLVEAGPINSPRGNTIICENIQN